MKFFLGFGRIFAFCWLLFPFPIPIALKLVLAFNEMCYFDGAEGILMPKVYILCTVAGLCFKVLEKNCAFLGVFLISRPLYKIFEHFYRLKLFLVFGRSFCFFAGCFFLLRFLLNRY